MTTVLFITPNLEYSGRTRRLMMLVRHLPRERFQPRVIVVGGASARGQALRDNGIGVDELGWRRPIDARPLFSLRQLASEIRPEIIHTSGTTAIVATLLAGIARRARLIVSDVLPLIRDPNWIGRHLLRHVGRIIANGRVEADRYRRAGVAPARLTEVPLATDAEWPRPAEEAAAAESIGAGRVVLGVGPLDWHKGFRDAVWTFDILQFLYEDLQLVIAGSGPDRQRVQDFARVTGTGGRVHCLGPVADLAPLRKRALLAWIPGVAGGVHAALEAMAADLPVIASRTASLSEVIRHGETGLLARPGDQADLARQTRLLLEDSARRDSLAAAARRRAIECFTPGAMADAVIRAYEA